MVEGFTQSRINSFIENYIVSLAIDADKLHYSGSEFISIFIRNATQWLHSL